MPQFQDPPLRSPEDKKDVLGVISHLCSFEGGSGEKRRRGSNRTGEREKTREADDGRMPRYGGRMPRHGGRSGGRRKGIRKDGGCRLVGTEPRNEAERRKRRTR